jgi:hypothetical protein
MKTTLCPFETIINYVNHPTSENMKHVTNLLESLVLLDEQMKALDFRDEKASFILDCRQTIIEHLVKIFKPRISSFCRSTELGKLQELIDDCLISLNDYSSIEYWQKRIDNKVCLLIHLDEAAHIQLKSATPAEAQFDGDDCGVHSPVSSDILKPLQPNENPKESICRKSFTGQMFIKQSGTSVPFERYVEAIITEVGDRSKCHFLLFEDNRFVFNRWLWVSIDGESEKYHHDLFYTLEKRFPEFDLKSYVYEPHISPAMLKGALSFPFNDVEIKKPAEFFIHGDSSADWKKLHDSLLSVVGNCKTLMFQSRKKGWIPGRTMFVSVDNLNYDLTLDKLLKRINSNYDFIIPENYTVEMIDNISHCDSNNKELLERFTPAPTQTKGETIIVESQLLIDANYVQLAREFLSETKDIKFVLFNNPYKSVAFFSLAVTISGMNKHQAIKIFESLPSYPDYKLVDLNITESQIQTNKVPFVSDSDYPVCYYEIRKHCHSDVAESFHQLKKLKHHLRYSGEYEFFGPFEADQSKKNKYPYFILKTTNDKSKLYQELSNTSQKFPTIVGLCDMDKVNKLISP